MGTKARIVALVALGGLVAACSSTPRKPPHPLTLSNWHLIQIAYRDSNPFVLTPQQQSRHTATFNSNGSLQLTLDCNQGNGNWTASDPNQGNGVITIGPINSTRAFCPPPSFGDEMSLDLPNARNYSVRNGGGELRIFAGNAEFVFAPAPR